MGRRDRVEFRGLTYHAYARGNRRAAIWRAREEYDEYLDDLQSLSREHGAVVLSFSLMTNHPHLALRADGDPLSELMQRLNLRHSKRFNRVRGVQGRLYESRYHAQVVTSAEYLVRLVRYIHLNPVKARRVQRPEDWPYSSASTYLGSGRFPWVRCDEVKARLGGHERYLAFMGQKPAAEDEVLFESGRELPKLSEEDEAKSRRVLVPQPGDDFQLVRSPVHLPSAWKRERPKRPISEAAGVVASRWGCDLAAVASLARDERMLAVRRGVVKELRELGYRVQEIADILGRSEPAISRLLTRLRDATPEHATSDSARQVLLPWSD